MIYEHKSPLTALLERWAKYWSAPKSCRILPQVPYRSNYGTSPQTSH